jgi:hypothetical protein
MFSECWRGTSSNHMVAQDNNIKMYLTEVGCEDRK